MVAVEDPNPDPDPSPTGDVTGPAKDTGAAAAHVCPKYKNAILAETLLLSSFSMLLLIFC